MITLKALQHRGRMCVAIHGKLSPAVDTVIRNFPGRLFSITHRCWYIPDDRKMIDALVSVLSPLEEVVVELPSYRQSLSPVQVEPENPPNVVVPDLYEETLKVQRYSDATIINYIAQFRFFLEFILPVTADNFTEKDVHRYLNHLVNKRRVSISTQNVAINAIKFHLEHVKKEARAVYYIDRPRKEKKLPVVLSFEEVTALLGCVKNLKHRCLLMVMYSAGLRIGETLKLTRRDIDPGRRVVYVRGGKGKKDRITLLSRVALETLVDYLKQYKPQKWLFEGPSQEAYSERSVNKLIKKAASAAGILKPVSAHTLRHSFATHLLERGTDLRYIQQLLGHESSKTTERYAQVTKRGFEQLISPLDYLFSSNALEKDNKDV